jgi:hypothetical protein
MPLRCLLFVKRHFRQDGRLDQIFGLLGFFVRIHQLAAGIDQTRGHKNDQVPFDVLFSVRAEEVARRFGLPLKRGWLD